MKRLINLWLIIFLMIAWGFAPTAEARTGSTSSSSSKSSSSSYNSSKSSRSSSASSSSSSGGFFSSIGKSATDAAFSNAAKSNQAATAWQKRNQTPDLPPVMPPSPTNVPIPNVPASHDSMIAQQLEAIKKQLEEAKHRQQITAIAQTAAQIAANRLQSTTANPITTPPVAVPTTATAVVASQTPNANVSNTTPEHPKKGISWFTILLIIISIVWLISLFRKRAANITRYRL